MAEGKKEPDKAEKPRDDAEKSAAAGLPLKVGEALIPVLVTAGSLLGFVAFAGAVVLWTRLSAIGIPPEQALDVAPQGELVAIGAVFLLIFGFFGGLALAATFLVDRAARPTPGMARMLLVLLMIEGVVAIVLAEGRSPVQTVVDAELFVLPLALLVWATMVAPFGELEDDLARRSLEVEPDRRYGVLRPRETGARGVRLRWCAVFGPIGVVAIAALATMAMLALDSPNWVFLWVISGLGLIFLAWVLALVCWDVTVARETSTRERAAEARAARERREAERYAAGRLRRRLCRIAKRVSHKPATEVDKPADKDERLRHPGPLRLVLTSSGIVLVAISMALSIGLVLWRLGLEEWWVGVALTVAALVTTALWRLATFSRKRLVWFAVGVFLSVPLIGTITEIVNDLDHPQVQAVALIRKSDGPRESIQGLYVTETSNRVYFANVATEGCSNRTKPESARLLWIPKEDVLAMSIGPLQNVEQAGKSALEMSYTLTPAVETPGASVELGIDPKQEEEEREGAKSHDTRLENAGPAVRPNFGSGLSLEPEVASAGEQVTLRMGTPNFDNGVEGFGSARAGHNLRIGGERVDIVKEKMDRVTGAEYIGAKGGRLVNLAKDGRPYVLRGGEYVPLKEGGKEEGRELYVRIDDPNVLTVNGEPLSAENEYIEVARAKVGGTSRFAGNELVQVAEDTRVGLARADIEGREWPRETVSLNRHLLFRQAWHPRYIKFIVPDDAKTGEVTVECNQLAESQLLRVTDKPTARIAVRMQQGSGRVVFNSAGSEDDGKIVARSWKIGGLRRSRREKISARMPARQGIYSVRLTVTDDEGNTGTARFRLLRLPAPLFEFDKSTPKRELLVKDDAKALRGAVESESPVAIEIDGHADDPGSPRYNLNLSLERDDEVRKALMPDPAMVTEETQVVAVEEKAYGERCPLDPRPGMRPRNRRVDVFVLDRGVAVEPPVGCHPGRVESTRWRFVPKAPSSQDPTE